MRRRDGKAKSRWSRPVFGAVYHEKFFFVNGNARGSCFDTPGKKSDKMAHGVGNADAVGHIFNYSDATRIKALDYHDPRHQL